MKRLLLSALVSSVLASPAFGSTITFEDQIGPRFFDATAGPETLVYPVGSLQVTFTGGAVLTGESNQTSDMSSVYATGSWHVRELSNISHDFLNPIVINFSAPIQNLELDILNALAGDYELYDDAGNSIVFNLPTTGDTLATEGFAATGSRVSIVYLTAPGAWDFAIDNVRFNQPLTVPEPVTMTLVGPGLWGLAVLRQRRLGRAPRHARTPTRSS